MSIARARFFRRPRSIVHVRHAVTAGASSLSSAVILIVVTIQRRYASIRLCHRGRRVGVLLCPLGSMIFFVLMQDSGSGSRRYDVSAGLGDRRRRPDFRSGRSHHGVRSIEPNISSSVKALAVAPRPVRIAGCPWPRRRRRASRLPLLVLLTPLSRRWRGHRRNSTKPARSHWRWPSSGSHGLLLADPGADRSRGHSRRPTAQHVAPSGLPISAVLLAAFGAIFARRQIDDRRGSRSRSSAAVAKRADSLKERGGALRSCPSWRSQSHCCC